MKTILFISLISTLLMPNNACAISWWEQATICKLDPTDCYSSMGTGYDSQMWDATSNCWGLKLICAEALTTSTSVPVAMGRTEIASGKNINKDFDVNSLSSDCFGIRKTTSNGTQASVNGTYVKVWCNGILDKSDEYLSNGEITYGTQPTCSTLAQRGFVGIINNNCYGKYYNQSEYYIDCKDNDEITPERLIVLNGANYQYADADAPADADAADKLFDKMEDVSNTMRDKYYK